MRHTGAFHQAATFDASEVRLKPAYELAKEVWERTFDASEVRLKHDACSGYTEARQLSMPLRCD